MKCRICSNHEDNLLFLVQEKQYCTKDEFEYFQCNKCKCIQIVSIPENLEKYYPDNYYSFQQLQHSKKLSLFKKIQADYLIYNKWRLLGPSFTLGYNQPKLYTWLKNLKLKRSSKILDVGCGAGGTLHMMHQLGFENLTGIDPLTNKIIPLQKNLKSIKRRFFRSMQKRNLIAL